MVSLRDLFCHSNCPTVAIRACFALDEALEVVESSLLDSYMELFKGGVHGEVAALRSRLPQQWPMGLQIISLRVFVWLDRIPTPFGRIMALALHACKSRASQVAINISLTLDDSDSFGLVSFKSGVGELAFGGSGVQCRDLSGYLAVLRRGMAFSSKAFSQDDEADYSRDAGKRRPWVLAHHTVPKAMCRRPGSGARHLQERPPYSRGWNNGCVKLWTDENTKTETTQATATKKPPGMFPRITRGPSTLEPPSATAT